jgi:hypothetical protein
MLRVASSSPMSNKAFYRKLAAKKFGEWEMRIATDEQAAKYDRDRRNFRRESYLNNRYSVQISDVVTDWGLVVHLWIRRHDGEMVRSWSDMQRIKNELVGPERIGIEVFPPISELVDEANLAHIWVMPEDFKLPFGLGRGNS